MRKLLIFIFSFSSLPMLAQINSIKLAAEMGQTHILDDFTSVQMWGYGIIKPSGAYSASLPGPVLEFNLGDTVEIHFYNYSPEDHTIHLHGLDVSQAEDGVPMTSVAVDPNDSIVYNFVANNAGTFLYHCHVLTTLHLTMGMYGVIVVKNFPEQNLMYPGGPSFNKEHVFLTSDMDLSINTNPLSPGPFNLLVMDYFMVNGLSGNQLYTDGEHQITAYPGDSVLLRLGSMGYSSTRYIFPAEVNAICYASDGRTLPAPIDADTLIIYPGERYDVLLTPTAITDVDIQVEYYESRNNQLQHINYINLNADVQIAAQNKTELEIFPNPSIGVITVVSNAIGEQLIITDITGQIIYRTIINSDSQQIDFSNYANGIYILTCGNRSKKIIKR